MVKRKHDSEDEESAAESGVGTSEDEVQKKKKQKRAKPEPKVKPSAAKGKAKAPRADEQTESAEVDGIEFKVTGGESWLELGLKSKKRVTVRKFKGNTLVDIREYYEDRDSGEMKPGKKGVSLSADEWHDVARLSNAISVLVAGNEG